MTSRFGFTITFNVLNSAGFGTPIKASVSVMDVSKEAAVRAARKMMETHGVRVLDVPCSIRPAHPVRPGRRGIR